MDTQLVLRKDNYVMSRRVPVSVNPIPTSDRLPFPSHILSNPYTTKSKSSKNRKRRLKNLVKWANSNVHVSPKKLKKYCEKKGYIIVSHPKHDFEFTVSDPKTSSKFKLRRINSGWGPYKEKYKKL